MSERTLTVAEAAGELGITEKAVRRRIERGVLVSVMGPDRRRRIPASALGLNGNGASGGAGAPNGAPRVVQQTTGGIQAVYGPELLERLERLARENGALRQIEIVAGDREQRLIEAAARILELEALLARRRRWWRR